MVLKTISEQTFEKFCDANNIKWEKIKEEHTKTPDYKVWFGDEIVFFEIKQIDNDSGFDSKNGIMSRIVGSRIREKIKSARKQLKAVANKGYPLILLIYNNIDPLQLFGTEYEDFISAMYGHLTYLIDKNKNKIIDIYYGKNRSFDKNKSSYFSAIGHLYQTKDKIGITLYENVFANNKLNFNTIPESIKIIRF